MLRVATPLQTLVKEASIRDRAIRAGKNSYRSRKIYIDHLRHFGRESSPIGATQTVQWRRRLGLPDSFSSRWSGFNNPLAGARSKNTRYPIIELSRSCREKCAARRVEKSTGRPIRTAT